MSSTALAEELGQFYADPLGFVLFAFDWGKGELAAETGADAWQAEVLRELGAGVLTAEAAQRLAVASGHGIGKTSLVAWLILWAMSTRPHLAGVVTANTGTQLSSKTWRELAIWHKRLINRDWFEWSSTRFWQVDNRETWSCTAIPWSKERPEAFAGTHAEHVLLIFDEASAIDDVIWEVAEGAMTTRGAIWATFGNPTRATGRFRECFGRFKHRWTTRQIDSRTCKKANLAQVKQWAEDYGEDSDFMRVRVKGQFPNAAGTQLIPTGLVEAAQRRELVPDLGAALVLGVDVARFGDDESVLRFRRGRDARSIPAIRLRGKDTMQLVHHVTAAIERYKPAAVFVEGTGVGGGVIDRLRELRHRVQEVTPGATADDPRKFFNKRAEMWDRMRVWLETGALPADHGLRDDMLALEYGFDGNGRLQLERKQDMKRRGLASPDDADALAMTFAQSVPRADSRLRAAPLYALTDYDVLA